MTRFVRLLVWTVMVLGVLGLITWALFLSPLGPTDPSEGCTARGPCVEISEGGVRVDGAGGAAATGLIVYTGARVEPEAYVPVAERIAEAGYSVSIPRLPLNFAIFETDAASDVIREHPEITHWVVAGHSLGGAMAARYASEDDRVDGLVLWAAYPEASLDLSGSELVVASISASNDGLATADEIEDSRARLPSDTVFTVIEGGNHAQFGDYGEQRGDDPATITPESQWDQVAAATVRVLDAVDAGGGR